MTRSLHPTAFPPKSFGSSSMDASNETSSCDAMMIDGRKRVSAPAHPGAPSVALTHAPAVPISVTTASHADPIGLSSSQQLNLQVSSGGIPVKQMHLPPLKMNYTPPPSLAGPTGGFTLATNVASEVTPNVHTPMIKKSASAAPLMQAYSAASIASIHAQGEKNTVALGRTQSAPNTVILSTSQNKSKYKYRKVVGGKVPSSSTTSLEAEVTPQAFLDKMLRARGYSTNSFCSLDGGYYCKPTELQKASYGMKVIQAVRSSDHELLQSILDCGLSPNPCNQFGESVVHMVCRRGDFKLLQILVKAGCSLQVTDDFGRTPLHDACWTAEPSFDCVELILNHDSRLLHIVDCRGSSPLSYVKREHWKQWIDFFRRKAEVYWPQRDVSKEGEQTPPTLAGAAAHSGPISDPKNAIPEQLAALIASGKLDPKEFLRRRDKAMEDRKGKENQTTEAFEPVAATS